MLPAGMHVDRQKMLLTEMHVEREKLHMPGMHMERDGMHLDRDKMHQSGMQYEHPKIDEVQQLERRQMLGHGGDITLDREKNVSVRPLGYDLMGSNSLMNLCKFRFHRQPSYQGFTQRPGHPIEHVAPPMQRPSTNYDVGAVRYHWPQERK